ncbi:MAG TPA: PIN domain nuclease, partial [Verrucomicrobiae bacterium]|nr:PIN domain nuclease [Verrucomicrobiae bacterium]
PQASRVVANLPLRGDRPVITGQNLVEFWAVVTRPIDANGLGWSASRARSEVDQLQASFSFARGVAPRD